MSPALEPDTLRGRDVPAYSVPPERLVVVTDRKHPLFRDSALLPFAEPLVMAMMRFGCRQALIVQRDGDRLVVVDGNKRCAAAKEANRRLRERGEPEVKLIVTPTSGEDRDVLAVSAMVNAIRFKDNPLEQAIRCRRMVDLGSTLADCAAAFGVTVATIENWMKLDDLHPEVREKVRAGELKYTVAMRLARLPRGEQVPKLRKILRAGATNANAVRAVVGGRLERVTPPDKRTLRRIADELLKQKAYAIGDGESDAFSFVEYALGRISFEEFVGCVRSGTLANAVRTVVGCRR